MKDKQTDSYYFHEEKGLIFIDEEDSEVKKPDNYTNTLLKTIGDVLECLTVLQVKLANTLDALPQEYSTNTDAKVSYQEIDGGVKITVGECLPKMRVFERRISRNTTSYEITRERWYSLIQEAIQQHKKEIINKSIIAISHYGPHLSDPDNYTAKFIIDALRNLAVIFWKDDGDHVSIVHKCYIDKHNPRTEIIVLEDTGQLDHLFA